MVAIEVDCRHQALAVLVPYSPPAIQSLHAHVYNHTLLKTQLIWVLCMVATGRDILLCVVEWATLERV
jgi:hypothetical protein